MTEIDRLESIIRKHKLALDRERKRIVLPRQLLVEPEWLVEALLALARLGFEVVSLTDRNPE